MKFKIISSPQIQNVLIIGCYRSTLSLYGNTQHLDILTKVDMVDKSELCPEDKNMKIRYGVVRIRLGNFAYLYQKIIVGISEYCNIL